VGAVVNSVIAGRTGDVADRTDTGGTDATEPTDSTDEANGKERGPGLRERIDARTQTLLEERDLERNRLDTDRDRSRDVDQPS